MKFLQHLNKHRKWYLLGIGVAWLLVSLFVPSLYIDTPMFGASRKFHTTFRQTIFPSNKLKICIFISYYAIPLIAVVFFLFSKTKFNLFFEILFFLSTLTVVASLAVYCFSFTVEHKQLVSYFIGAYILCLLSAASFTLVASEIHRILQKPSKAQQISDLQRQIDELKQNQEQRR